MKITYWITTGIIAFMMLFSAYAYITQPAMLEAFKHLGFPNYFRIELAVAKILGAVILLAPVSARLKEWAYAGFAFTFISAIIAHTASGDPAKVIVMPLVLLILLIVSYVSYYKLPKASAVHQTTAAV